jgi:hypothetical protein
MERPALGEEAVLRGALAMVKMGGGITLRAASRVLGRDE